VVYLTDFGTAACLQHSSACKGYPPGGPFVQPNQHVSYSAIMTFDEVRDELFKRKKRSKDLLQVDIARYTVEDRSLYISKIGWWFEENVDPDRWWDLPWSTYDYGNWDYRE
jgi:hypothetical protein